VVEDLNFQSMPQLPKNFPPLATLG
jgi:hypothetical protein